MVVLGSSWNNLDRASTQISSNWGLDQCPQGWFLVPTWDLYQAYRDVSVAYTEEINGVGNKCLIDYSHQ